VPEYTTLLSLAATLGPSMPGARCLCKRHVRLHLASHLTLVQLVQSSVAPTGKLGLHPGDRLHSQCLRPAGVYASQVQSGFETLMPGYSAGPSHVLQVPEVGRAAKMRLFCLGSLFCCNFCYWICISRHHCIIPVLPTRNKPASTRLDRRHTPSSANDPAGYCA